MCVRAEALPRCELLYLDIGSNMGDSIDDFVNLRPEKRLVPLLAMAVPRWSPATTCIHGFEPNPRWVKRLQNVTRRLHSRTASLTVHYAGVTHLAPGHATLTLDGGARNEGASLVARPLSSMRARVGKGGSGAMKDATTHTVPTINLVQWLSARLDDLPGVPVVIRMDVEGAEYNLLRELAVSGLGARTRIFVGVEFHRFLKARVLAAVAPFLRMYDERMAHFNRKPDGSLPRFNRKPAETRGDTRGGAQGEVRGEVRGEVPAISARDKLAVSALAENMEKVLAFMLWSARITLSPNDSAKVEGASSEVAVFAAH